jgi:hypothetical protein
MNKMIKALISVLLIGMIAFPATVFAAGQISTVTVDALDTDDVLLTVNVDVETDTVMNEKLTVDVEAKDVDGNVVFATPEKQKDIVVAAGASELFTFNFAIDEDLDAEDLTVTVTTVFTVTTALNEAKIVDMTVTEASPEELFEGDLIAKVDIEEDELTFNEEVEFTIDFELTASEATEAVENAYFEIALYQDDNKLVGWVESEDDNIRFDEDEEVTFDQDDLRKSIIVPALDDIEMNGDEETLELRINVYGDYKTQNQHLLDTATETITVEKLDDHLSIETVSIEQQGNVLYTAITVENDGEENQEDVRATIEIDGLNVKQTSNKVTVYEEDEATIYIPVVLPALTSGEYNLEVTVYNSEVSAEFEIEDVELTGTTGPQPNAEGGVVIGIDTAMKTVTENGAVYAITFTNNDATQRTFVLETAGAEWGQTSVNPSTIVVGAGSSEIASIFVAPNAGEQGTRQFTVFVKEGSQIVKSIGLTANVEGAQATGAAGYDFDGFVNSGLKWIAAILVVVLIVLFVVWSWHKDEDEEL